MYASTPQVKPRRRIGGPLIAALILLAVLCGGFVLIGACASVDQPSKHVGEPVATTRATAAAPVATIATPATSPVSSPAASTKPKPAPKPKATIDEGLWHVGEDVPAGTYRAADSVAGMDCYWEKTTDSEGDNIIANDLPTGGRPQVTLKKGQWFTTQRCGIWVKK